MELRFIDTKDPLYEEERALRSKELREPLGFPPGAELFPFENVSLHLVAIEDGKLVGCVLFHPEGKSGRLYQMAVAKGTRRKGIGKKLVAELEKHIEGEGFDEIYLHSREIAVSFYEKMGYMVTGKPFMEIGINHRMMRKRLREEGRMSQGNIKEPGPISLDHKPLYDDYLKRYPTQISEHTFTSLFMWRKMHPVHFIEAANSLLVYEEREEGIILYGMPLGPISPESVADILESHTSKKLLICDYIPESVASSSLPRQWDVVESRAHFDYVYAQTDLANLEGRHYAKKRNLISQCLANNRCEYEEISAHNIAEVSDMMDRWCDYRGCKGDRGLCNEFRATRELLQNYDSLGVMGAAIRIDKRIEAFTVGEALNENTAVIHLEKAMPEFKGLYQLINQWFSKNHLARFEFVNRECDLGIPGLRQAKESYHPRMLIKKFLVYPHGREKGALAESPELKRCLDEEG